MLDYQKDRVDYGEALKPPEGYHLSRAVGATYSLDLHALLCIPVALFYARNLDSNVSDNRLDVLDAIQKTAECVTVYCQKGKIQVPKGHYKILAFIEDSVREVLPRQAFASFHPKTWIIRFEAEGKPTLYRVMVLSRNITFDRSWDMAMFMEGFVGDSVQPKTQSLVDYSTYLNSESPFQGFNEFVSDLSKVSFASGGDMVDFNFHPIGIPGYEHPLPRRFKRSLIVSPFLHPDALKDYAKQSSNPRYLFSRREELDKIGLEILDGFETYCLSETVVEGEEYFEEESASGKQQQNLHAKFYVGEDDYGYHWYLGSANCSTAARERNTEFLVHLNWRKWKSGVENTAKHLISDGKVAFFQKYHRENPEISQNIDYDFRSETHSLIQAISSGDFISVDLIECSDSKNTFSINLNFSEIPGGFDNEIIKLRCGLMGEPLRTVSEGASIHYPSIHLNRLSPFIHWHIEHTINEQSTEFITKLDIDLPEQRLNSIFRNIIDSSDKFFMFLQFLLGSGDTSLGILTDSNKNGKSNGSPQFWQNDAPILEELMVASSRNPSKLKDIERVISRLNEAGEESTVPADFNDFWLTFKTFIHDDKG